MLVGVHRFSGLLLRGLVKLTITRKPDYFTIDPLARTQWGFIDFSMALGRSRLEGLQEAVATCSFGPGGVSGLLEEFLGSC